jgi:hypothetical protein
MLPSAVNDTMRDMMAQIRDVGDGIRGGTYTMTAPVITGGSITGVALSGNTLTNPVITGGSINNTTVGANTAAAGNFTTLGATGVATFSAGTNSAPAITTTGDTNTGIFFPAADTIAFTEGGAESMRIDSAGNVGIGTTSPSSYGKLAVVGGATVIGRIAAETGNGKYSDLILGNIDHKAGIRGQHVSSGNTFLSFLTENLSGDGYAERMRIDSTGKVGIGTTSPDALLSVNGIASFGDGAAATPSIANFGDLNTGFWFPAADTIAASTAGSERMRIHSNGGVSIGNTTSSGAGTLNVNGKTVLGPSVPTGDVTLTSQEILKSTTLGSFDIGSVFTVQPFKKASSTTIALTFTRQAGLLVYGATNAGYAPDAGSGTIQVVCNGSTVTHSIISQVAVGGYGTPTVAVSGAVLTITFPVSSHIQGSFIGTCAA